MPTRIFGKSIPLSQIALSAVGWDSVGNSNWFIFITLLSYVFISFAYLIFHKASNITVVACVTLFIALSIPLLKHKGGWWVDTCLCIPVGMLFCIIRNRIEAIIRRIPIPVWLIGALTIIFGVVFYQRSMGLLGYYGLNIGAIIFVLGVTLISSGVSLKRTPAFLNWSGGRALFYLYIFQRIPMLIGARLGWNKQNPYLYETFCLCTTIVIAYICVQIFPRIDKRISSFIKREPRTGS